MKPGLVVPAQDPLERVLVTLREVIAEHEKRIALLEMQLQALREKG